MHGENGPIESRRNAGKQLRNDDQPHGIACLLVEPAHGCGGPIQREVPADGFWEIEPFESEEAKEIGDGIGSAPVMAADLLAHDHQKGRYFQYERLRVDAHEDGATEGAAA